MTHRFEVLDSFRGLAALFVVIHHMHYVGSISELSFFKHSSLFVEFFFILSGFVLAHAYAYKKSLQFKEYFIARTFRIFPLHLFVLMVFILLELLKLWVHHNIMPLHTIPFENSMSPSEILPNIFLLQSWLSHAHILSFNPPAWSISIEYYMYMIFFVTLLFKPVFTIMSWVFISVTMFYFIVIGMSIDTVILRGLSSFFLGVLVYILYKNFYAKITFSSMYFSILELAVLLLVPYILTAHIVIYKPLIMTGLFACIVFVFAFQKGVLSRILRYKIFLFFGKISYSIYMIHVFILFSFLWVIILIEKIFKIQLTPEVAGIVYIDLGLPLYNNILVFVLLAVIVFISRFTYTFIEKRGQEWGKRLR
jgi:peptidoglycan/LPS O-acetylase OafA/YrhL